MSILDFSSNSEQSPQIGKIPCSKNIFVTVGKKKVFSGLSLIEIVKKQSKMQPKHVLSKLYKLASCKSYRNIQKKHVR